MTVEVVYTQLDTDTDGDGFELAATDGEEEVIVCIDGSGCGPVGIFEGQLIRQGRDAVFGRTEDIDRRRAVLLLFRHTEIPGTTRIECLGGEGRHVRTRCKHDGVMERIGDESAYLEGIVHPDHFQTRFVRNEYLLFDDIDTA